jgi:hypothetical protein
MKTSPNRAPSRAAAQGDSEPVAWTLPAGRADGDEPAATPPGAAPASSITDAARPERREHVGPVPRRDPGEPAPTAPKRPAPLPPTGAATAWAALQPAASARRPMSPARRRAAWRASLGGLAVVGLIVISGVWWFDPWLHDKLDRSLIMAAPQPAPQPAAAVPRTSVPSPRVPVVSPPPQAAVAESVQPVPGVAAAPSPGAEPVAAAPTASTTAHGARSAPRTAATPAHAPAPAPRVAPAKAHAPDPRCSELLARQSLGDPRANQLSVQWKCQ